MYDPTMEYRAELTVENRQLTGNKYHLKIYSEIGLVYADSSYNINELISYLAEYGLEDTIDWNNIPEWEEN